MGVEERSAAPPSTKRHGWWETLRNKSPLRGRSAREKSPEPFKQIESDNKNSEVAVDSNRVIEAKHSEKRSFTSPLKYKIGFGKKKSTACISPKPDSLQPFEFPVPDPRTNTPTPCSIVRSDSREWINGGPSSSSAGSEEEMLSSRKLFQELPSNKESENKTRSLLKTVRSISPIFRKSNTENIKAKENNGGSKPGLGLRAAKVIKNAVNGQSSEKKSQVSKKVLDTASDNGSSLTSWSTQSSQAVNRESRSLNKTKSHGRDVSPSIIGHNDMFSAMREEMYNSNKQGNLNERSSDVRLQTSKVRPDPKPDENETEFLKVKAYLESLKSEISNKNAKKERENLAQVNRNEMKNSKDDILFNFLHPIDTKLLSGFLFTNSIPSSPESIHHKNTKEETKEEKKQKEYDFDVEENGKDDSEASGHGCSDMEVKKEEENFSFSQTIWTCSSPINPVHLKDAADSIESLKEQGENSVIISMKEFEKEEEENKVEFENVLAKGMKVADGLKEILMKDENDAKLILSKQANEVKEIKEVKVVKQANEVKERVEEINEVKEVQDAKHINEVKEERVEEIKEIIEVNEVKVVGDNGVKEESAVEAKENETQDVQEVNQLIENNEFKCEKMEERKEWKDENLVKEEKERKEHIVEIDINVMKDREDKEVGDKVYEGKEEMVVEETELKELEVESEEEEKEDAKEIEELKESIDDEANAFDLMNNLIEELKTEKVEGNDEEKEAMGQDKKAKGEEKEKEILEMEDPKTGKEINEAEVRIEDEKEEVDGEKEKEKEIVKEENVNEMIMDGDLNAKQEDEEVKVEKLFIEAYEQKEDKEERKEVKYDIGCFYTDTQKEEIETLEMKVRKNESQSIRVMKVGEEEENEEQEDECVESGEEIKFQHNNYEMDGKFNSQVVIVVGKEEEKEEVGDKEENESGTKNYENVNENKNENSFKLDSLDKIEKFFESESEQDMDECKSEVIDEEREELESKLIMDEFVNEQVHDESVEMITLVRKEEEEEEEERLMDENTYCELKRNVGYDEKEENESEYTKSENESEEVINECDEERMWYVNEMYHDENEEREREEESDKEENESSVIYVKDEEEEEEEECNGVLTERKNDVFQSELNLSEKEEEEEEEEDEEEGYESGLTEEESDNVTIDKEEKKEWEEEGEGYESGVTEEEIDNVTLENGGKEVGEQNEEEGYESGVTEEDDEVNLQKGENEEETEEDKDNSDMTNAKVTTYESSGIDESEREDSEEMEYGLEVEEKGEESEDEYLEIDGEEEVKSEVDENNERENEFYTREDVNELQNGLTEEEEEEEEKEEEEENEDEDEEEDIISFPNHHTDNHLLSDHSSSMNNRRSSLWKWAVMGANGLDMEKETKKIMKNSLIKNARRGSSEEENMESDGMESDYYVNVINLTDSVNESMSEVDEEDEEEIMENEEIEVDSSNSSQEEGEELELESDLEEEKMEMVNEVEIETEYEEEDNEEEVEDEEVVEEDEEVEEEDEEVEEEDEEVEEEDEEVEEEDEEVEEEDEEVEEEDELVEEDDMEEGKEMQSEEDEDEFDYNVHSYPLSPSPSDNEIESFIQPSPSPSPSPSLPSGFKILEKESVELKIQREKLNMKREELERNWKEGRFELEKASKMAKSLREAVEMLTKNHDRRNRMDTSSSYLPSHHLLSPTSSVSSSSFQNYGSISSFSHSIPSSKLRESMASQSRKLMADDLTSNSRFHSIKEKSNPNHEKNDVRLNKTKDLLSHGNDSNSNLKFTTVSDQSENDTWHNDREEKSYVNHHHFYPNHDDLDYDFKNEDDYSYLNHRGRSHNDGHDRNEAFHRHGLDRKEIEEEEEKVMKMRRRNNLIISDEDGDDDYSPSFKREFLLQAKSNLNNKPSSSSLLFSNSVSSYGYVEKNKKVLVTDFVATNITNSNVEKGLSVFDAVSKRLEGLGLKVPDEREWQKQMAEKPGWRDMLAQLCEGSTNLPLSWSTEKIDHTDHTNRFVEIESDENEDVILSPPRPVHRLIQNYDRLNPYEDECESSDVEENHNLSLRQLLRDEEEDVERGVKCNDLETLSPTRHNMKLAQVKEKKMGKNQFDKGDFDDKENVMVEEDWGGKRVGRGREKSGSSPPRLPQRRVSPVPRRPRTPSPRRVFCGNVSLSPLRAKAKSVNM